ncbi:unnamed protein product [Coregonus sp. 'balchen']|nr:unnamed protein product [Coregonus sp. 'balchen']
MLQNCTRYVKRQKPRSLCVLGLKCPGTREAVLIEATVSRERQGYIAMDDIMLLTYPCYKAPHFSRLGDEEVNAGQNATFQSITRQPHIHNSYHHLLQSVTRSYYRNSVGGLLVFDLTNRASFEHVQEWHAEVCEHVQPHTVLFVLVGHKNDRVAQGERVVGHNEAEKLVGQLGMPYIEASAKTGQCVTEAFELLTRRVYQGLLSGEVQLQEGWDGVKCLAPRASLVQLQKTRINRQKCCS